MTGIRNGPGTSKTRERDMLTGALLPVGPLELSAEQVSQIWSSSTGTSWTGEFEDPSLPYGPKELSSTTPTPHNRSAHA